MLRPAWGDGAAGTQSSTDVPVSVLSLPQDVLHRHALYLIIRMVCYDDGLGAGKSLLALKTTDASNEEYSLWVYQCSSLVRPVSLVSLLPSAWGSRLPVSP